MANIILTNTCNIKCPFCFASENNNLDDDSFDILKAWKISTFLTGKFFRFCGGEPSIHPDITKMMDALLSANSHILIMTNGIWPTTFADYIRSLPNKFLIKVRYLFNILEPSFYKKGQFKKICDHLEVINPQQASLGFTIYKDDFSYDYLLDLANRYQIKRIRWSVAAPNMANDLHTLEPKFSKISEQLYEFYMSCFDKGIEVSGDCNYIQPCFYNTNHLNEIMIRSKKYFPFSCSNVSPVDIGSKGMAWRCYGLYSVLRKNINGFQNENDLEKYFTRRVRLLENMYAYEECRQCDYWQQGCAGGCYVFRIKKAIKQNPSLILFPIDDDQEILKCRPYRDKNVLIKEYENSNMLFFNSILVADPDENTLSFLKEIDGQKTIADLIALWRDNFSSLESAQVSIIQKCRELFEADMIRINYDYAVQPEKRPAPTKMEMSFSS